jgi:hypothetical protein
MSRTRSSRFEPAPLVPLAIDATPAQLQRFGRLMARQGWRVNLARMALDRVYARDCIAQAHTSADAPLRALAVALFEACMPGGHAPGRRA